MLLNDLIEGLKDMFFTFLYTCFRCICELIDFIKEIFYMLCGIEPVEINGAKGDMLTSLLGSDSVKKAFLTISIIGVILLVLFTGIAILKSNYQEKQSWAGALRKSGQSLLITLLIPFTVLAGILLTNTVMSSINVAMNPYGNTAHPLIGGQFLSTIGNGCYIGSEDKSVVLSKFVSGELDYKDVSLVKSYFNIQAMNYLIGILGGFVMLVMFVLSSISFIQRIFDIILLYLISPISIATIPLDEGNRFKVWKDMMIGKILSAYGIILVTNLFFLIIPLAILKGDPSTYYDGMAGFLATKEKYPELRTIFHSDQRSAYSSEAFNEMPLPHDITRTMSRVGTPADNGATEAINGWAKAEMLVDFRIGDAEDVPAAVAGYVKFFNEERPMCCLGYMTPKQYREASLKRDPRPLPPYQRRHLPTVAYPKLNLMATND